MADDAGQTLSGAELARALSDGTMEDGDGGPSLEVMVKAGEAEGTVMVSQAGCSDWVAFPAAAIERAERIGSAPCEGHSHPMMRLTLAAPEDATAAAALALLGQRARGGRAGRMAEGRDRGADRTPAMMRALAGRAGRGRGLGLGGVIGGWVPPDGSTAGCYLDCFLEDLACDAHPVICELRSAICDMRCEGLLPRL
ncbi:hypothetical protein JQC91_09790 [Jannaschia sp. Os4]|uniref:hypothetical protein n=1 Tax=Jannaschia sp. Os4 TaxID=2807617 RepID=UPI00193974EA|nr:hypothetical protein [Jannaschia sp. Os4]MBM2576595.1 hypothetical protein [Jannaschia sp. Os4]